MRRKQHSIGSCVGSLAKALLLHEAVRPFWSWMLTPRGIEGYIFGGSISGLSGRDRFAKASHIHPETVAAASVPKPLFSFAGKPRLEAVFIKAALPGPRPRRVVVPHPVILTLGRLTLLLC